MCTAPYFSSRMKLALLSDIHSNLEALGACLEHAGAEGAQRYAFLGDLVGYGADPVAVLDCIAGYVARGAIAVLGNHDAAAIDRLPDSMNEDAARAIEWTRPRLLDRHRAFLAGLPLTAAEDDLFFVHGSAAAPDKWIYITDPLRAADSIAASGASHVFCGHVHEPTLFYTAAAGRPRPFYPVSGVPIPVGRHRKWLSIVGSVGQPRDGNVAACYAILDTDKALLTYHRVPYDYPAAAARIRAAGLPEYLAWRLEHGV